MSQVNKWHFEPAGGEQGVRGFIGSLMLGPYYVAEILQTAGVAIDDYTPLDKFSRFRTVEFVERIVRVLNRELPGGKFRVRRKGAK